jgi:predicted RNA-binding protein associated with RNAse of E/G family
MGSSILIYFLLIYTVSLILDIDFLMVAVSQIAIIRKETDSAIGKANQVALRPENSPKRYMPGTKSIACLKKVMAKLGIPFPRA